VANVTSSGNTTIKPTISAAKFMGASHAAGSALENEIKNINLSLSTLAIKIKKNFENINLLSETIQNASLHSHTDNDDSDGDNKDNISNDDNSKLDEINSILLDIGNAISLDFANRITENKEDISDTKKQKSKGKFGRAESGIEKQKQKKAGNIFTKTADKASSPLSGIFGKLLQLGGILGTGALVNAAFEWLKNEENQEKMSTFFKIIKKNWKWMLGTAGVLIGIGLLLKAIAAIKVIGAVLAALSNPVFLGVLAIAASGMGAKWMLDKVTEYYDNDPTGKKNYVGAPIPGAPKDANPGDYFQDSKGKYWIKQNFDSSNGGWSGPRDKPPSKRTLKFTGGVNLTSGSINKVDKDIKVDTISKKSGMNFIPINLPTITKNQPQLPSISSVATNVLHISSKNVSDPYRQLTPDIYGIYV
tara:strand:- start:1779 stop:3032 length:1254 start_codon:yes stop_codon:yes gene_type:complete